MPWYGVPDWDFEGAASGWSLYEGAQAVLDANSAYEGQYYLQLHRTAGSFGFAAAKEQTVFATGYTHTATVMVRRDSGGQPLRVWLDKGDGNLDFLVDINGHPAGQWVEIDLGDFIALGSNGEIQFRELDTVNTRGWSIDLLKIRPVHGPMTTQITKHFMKPDTWWEEWLNTPNDGKHHEFVFPSGEYTADLRSAYDRTSGTWAGSRDGKDMSQSSISWVTHFNADATIQYFKGGDSRPVYYTTTPAFYTHGLRFKGSPYGSVGYGDPASTPERDAWAETAGGLHLVFGGPFGIGIEQWDNYTAAESRAYRDVMQRAEIADCTFEGNTSLQVIGSSATERPFTALVHNCTMIDTAQNGVIDIKGSEPNAQGVGELTRRLGVQDSKILVEGIRGSGRNGPDGLSWDPANPTWSTHNRGCAPVTFQNIGEGTPIVLRDWDVDLYMHGSHNHDMHAFRIHQMNGVPIKMRVIDCNFRGHWVEGHTVPGPAVNYKENGGPLWMGYYHFGGQILDSQPQLSFDNCTWHTKIYEAADYIPAGDPNPQNNETHCRQFNAMSYGRYDFWDCDFSWDLPSWWDPLYPYYGPAQSATAFYYGNNDLWLHNCTVDPGAWPPTATPQGVRHPTFLWLWDSDDETKQFGPSLHNRKRVDDIGTLTL